MAYKINPLYNLDQPVGAGQPNRPDDVMLVQFLLTEVAKRSPNWKGHPSPLAVDGKYTPALTEWIKSVQAQGSRPPDGIVHPQVNPHWKIVYTLASLNVAYRKYYGAAKHDGLPSDASVPSALRVALTKAVP